MSHRVKDWRILEIYTEGDQLYISYTFASSNRIVEDDYKMNARRFNARKLNANRLRLEVNRLYSRVEVSVDVRIRVEQIRDPC